MKLTKLLGIAVLLVVARSINSVPSLVNPDGIESGLAEVSPLSATTTLTINWNDAGVLTTPYIGIALVHISSAPRTDYKVKPVLGAVSSTSATFSLTLSSGWVKLVYRWIISKGEPLVTTIITLGPTAAGPLTVPLPAGTPTTFPATSIEKVDTLIAGFDYTNPGVSTGLNIQVKPVVALQNAVYNDFVTDVNPATNQLVPPPITTSGGQLTLSLQISFLNGAILHSISFTVILHTVAQKAVLTPDVITGYGIPTVTQSGISSIIDQQKNLISIVDPEAIYGTNTMNFPDSNSGIDYKIDLPQAQSVSALFAVPVTSFAMGVYMYAIKYPCASGLDVTPDLKLGIAGSWNKVGNDGTFTQNNNAPSLYLEMPPSPGANARVIGRLQGGINLDTASSYELSFDLSYITPNGEISVRIDIGTLQPFTFSNPADGIPMEPLRKHFIIQIPNPSNSNQFQVTMFEPVTGLNNILISNIKLTKGASQHLLGTTPYTCSTPASPACNVYQNPFNPPVPLLPEICRTCTPNPVTGVNGCNCPPGYYSSVVGLTSTCLLCQVSFCQSCTPAVGPVVATTCVVCDYGRTVNANGECVCPAGTSPSPLGPCITCSSQCETCDSSTGCLTCKTMDGIIPTNRNVIPVQGACVCNLGFFDTGVAVCSPCNPVCRTCEVNAGACKSCKPNSNTQLSGSSCICKPGFTQVSPSDGSCYNCDVTCATCQGPSQSDCLTCPSTRQLFTNNAGPGACYCIIGFSEQNPHQASCVVGNCGLVTLGCVNCDITGCIQCSESLNFKPVPVAQRCQCKTGFYFNAPTSTCVACGTACVSCGAGGICSNCYQGANPGAGGVCNCPVGTYPNQATLSCTPCTVNGCSTCVSNTCTGCQNPWVYVSGGCVCPDLTYLSNGNCVNCPPGCRLCNAAGCSSCITNYFLLGTSCVNSCPETFVGVSGVCVNCPTSCKTCSSPTSCTICSIGFYLYRGTCVSTCPDDTFTNNTATTCQPCGAPCSTCSSSAIFCTSCLPGSGYLLQGTCVPTCPSMTTSVGRVCLPCDPNCATCFGSQDFCSSCAPPRLLYIGTCVPTCPPNTYLYGSQCFITCPTSTFPSGTFCANCTTGCDACNNSNSCTHCPGNKFLLNGDCLTTCPTNTIPYYGADGGVCLTCLPNCAQCSSPTVCSLCISDQYILVQGNCTKCLGNSVINPVTGLCQPCPANCLICVNSTFCSQCTPTTISANGQCVTCLSPCATCNNGATSCSSCINGYAFAGTSCVQSCPIPGQSIVNGVCQCRVGYLSNGQCVPSCPTGTGPNNIRVCENCPTNCVNCSASVSACQECRIGFSQPPNSNGSCVPNRNCSYGEASAFGFCIRICNTGFFFYEGFCYVTCPIGFVVNSANSGCVLSSGSITCRVGQVSYQGVCLNQCPLGTFVSNGACLNCSLNCNKCINATYCTNCASGFYFSTGSCLLSAICAPPQLSLGATCVLSCPDGTYPAGFSCEKVCDDNLVFYNRWCYQNCPNGSFSNGYGCITACPLGQVPINGVCNGNSSTSCTNGFFLSGATCLPCQSPCATCVGRANVCTSCIFGVLSNGRCLRSNNRENALLVNVVRSTLIGNQFEVVLNLSVPINNLSTEQLNQFFLVVVTPNDRDGDDDIQVFQWVTNGGSRIHVLLQFRERPHHRSQVYLRLNVAALANSYSALGITDFSRANAQVSINNAERGDRRIETEGRVATFARRAEASRL